MNLRSHAWQRWLSAGAFVCCLSLHLFAQLPSRTAILSTISNVNNYWIQNNSAGSNNNYWDGAVYMIGDMDAYAATGNSNYLSYAQAWAKAYNYALMGGNSTRNANDQAAGEVYVRLYQLSGTSSDLTNITADVNGMVKSSSSSDWTWVDALNMAMPVFAELGQVNNSSTYAAKMYSEYNYTKTSLGGPGLYNTTVHLWSRDATFLGTNIYWSRGNAWAFVALAKVLETLPTNDPHYSDYLGTFQAMAVKLLTLQQSDGFWYANLTNPSQYPTPETSGTAGFTYGLAWGINAGALDSATYLPAVTKAWNGMVATAVHSNGFLGYVQGTGTQPSSSQPVTYNSTADFGVGLFLEAGNQVAKLAGASGTPVAAPTFSPGGGTYSSVQTVTISTTTSGASIRYTTDGSTPSETAGTLYSGPVSVGSTATLNAIAYESGFTDSAVVSAAYTISTIGGPVATPVFNPGGGTYSSAQTVTISTTTNGASIRYTTDGSMPSETAGMLYSGPVNISSTATLTAIAYESGFTDSAINSATYTISIGGRTVAAPTFSPGGGTYSSVQTVRISTTTRGASIRYTTDGSIPSETTGMLYSGSVSISSTTTLKAIAYRTNFTDSAIVSAAYTIGTQPPPQVATPVFSPGGGTYSNAQSVAISTTTSGASIRYTTDGSTPSETAGILYSGPVSIGSTATLQAMAYESGMTDSTVTSAIYTISVVSNRSLTGSSGNGFHALALTSAQSGTFTATFDATPSASPENGLVGLSQGAATAYGSIACIARFNPSGDIDAYNGTGYAAVSMIPYSADATYHFRLVVNVPANTYSVYVTPPGGSELTVGANYVFRTAVTSLDTWNLDENTSPAGCSLTANNLTP